MINKFIKSLLLLSFAFIVVADVAYYDTMDLQHHHIEDNHETIEGHAKLTIQLDIEAHCASHTLHHCLAAAALNQRVTAVNIGLIFSNADDLITGQSIQPATPPPLNLLT